MMLKMFAVRDLKMESFGKPFFGEKESGVIREFSDAVNDDKLPGNMWNKHPEDYAVFVVGEFDSETGEVIPCIPKSLITATAVKAVTAQPEQMEFGSQFVNHLNDKTPVA